MTTRQYRPTGSLETKRDPAMSSREWTCCNSIVWTNKAAVETPGPKEPEDSRPRKAAQKPELKLYAPPCMRNNDGQALGYRPRAPTNDGSKVLAGPTTSKPFEEPPPDIYRYTNYRKNSIPNGGRAQPHRIYQQQYRTSRGSLQISRVEIKAREPQETFRADTQQNFGIGKTQKDFSLVSDRSPNKSGNSLGGGPVLEDASPPKHHPATMTQQDVSLLDRVPPIKLGHGLAPEDVSPPKRYPESTMTQQDVSLVSNGLSRIKLGDGIVPRNDSPPKPHPESAVVQEDVSLVSDRLSLGNSSGDSLVPRNDSPPKSHPESAVVQEDVSLVSDRLSLNKFGNSLGDVLILRKLSPLKCEPESVKPLEDDTHLEHPPVIIKIPTVPMRHSLDPPNTNLDMILRPIAERPSTFNNSQLVDDSSSSTGGVPLDISSDDSSATPTDSEDNDNSMSTIDLPEQSEFKGSKNQPLEDGSEAGSSCSTSTAAARPASACINKEAFYHQFSNVNALLPPVSPGGENTAESEFNTLIGNLKAGQNPQEHTSTESRRTTATLVTPPVPFRPPPSRSRAERNISTRPLRDTEMSIPEWELPRCYTCFQERHYRNGILQCCPNRQHQHQSILYKEQLRDRLGVICREWTENIIRSQDVSAQIKAKHYGYQKIWTPYVSTVSGMFVSPFTSNVSVESRTAHNARPLAIPGVIQHNEPPRAASNAGSSAVSSVIQCKEPPRTYSERDMQTEDLSSSDQAVQSTSDQAVQSTSDLGVQTESPKYINGCCQTDTPQPQKDTSRHRKDTPQSRKGTPQPRKDTPQSVKDKCVQTDPVVEKPVPVVEKSVPVMEKSVQTLEKFVPTREKNFGSKLSTSSASATEGVITGKTYEHCWLCGKSHFNNQPCVAQQESSSNDQDWDTSNWQEQLNMVSPSKNNTLRKQNTKQKTKKANKVLTMARSHLIESDTTAYKIENGDKEEIYDRTDLTMLPLLDREARRNIVGSSDDESYHNRRLHVRNNSPLARCPNEILEKILTYAADEYASDRKTKVKDIIAGHDFGLDDGVSDNMRRARNLAGAAKSCRQLRLIAQRILYKVVIIDKYKPLRKFALSLTTDPELGKMVQVFRVNLLQTNQSYKNRGFFKYQMDNRNVVSNTDFASLFVRVVESCPNLQVLSVKMYGSILGFGAVRGKFTKMREICISDPVSSGMVLNQMWNHLTDFPQLQKFKMVHSEMNDGVNFEPLEIPHHFADKALDFTFKDLSTLTLENAPEVSDELLVFLVRRFTALNKLAIVNCKLVSSGGLARVLEEIPGRLSTLVFWVWLDQSGCPSAREIKSSRYHLCSAISGYGETLSVLNMKPYRLCEDMWKGPGFKRLHRCNIDMMQFCHCRNEDNSRDESSFEAAYKVAREEERLPHLDESSAIFHLHTPGISFR